MHQNVLTNSRQHFAYFQTQCGICRNLLTDIYLGAFSGRLFISSGVSKMNVVVRRIWKMNWKAVSVSLTVDVDRLVARIAPALWALIPG